MKTKIEITKKQIQHNNYNNKLTRGMKMKYFLILSTIIVTNMSAQDPFEFVQSTQQAFYYFDEVKINGEYIDSNDWVGAYLTPCSSC